MVCLVLRYLEQRFCHRGETNALDILVQVNLILIVILNYNAFPNYYSFYNILATLKCPLIINKYTNLIKTHEIVIIFR